MARDAPDRYLSTVRKADRRGRILVDWLRNGLDATAVASLCPRARPGAGVAAPLGWDEVTQDLDPATYNLHSIPARLARMRHDPWREFDSSRRVLPDLAQESAADTPDRTRRSGATAIVTARRPKRRGRRAQL
jgi:bifunctional non-homologous end joining protein LigD